jgi:hypothetical protein
MGDERGELGGKGLWGLVGQCGSSGTDGDPLEATGRTPSRHDGTPPGGVPALPGDRAGMQPGRSGVVPSLFLRGR